MSDHRRVTRGTESSETGTGTAPVIAIAGETVEARAVLLLPAATRLLLLDPQAVETLRREGQPPRPLRETPRLLERTPQLVERRAILVGARGGSEGREIGNASAIIGSKGSESATETSETAIVIVIVNEKGMTAVGVVTVDARPLIGMAAIVGVAVRIPLATGTESGSATRGVQAQHQIRRPKKRPRPTRTRNAARGEVMLRT